MSIEIHIDAIKAELDRMDLPAKIVALNQIRSTLHDISPFRGEPVDLVLWVPADQVSANDYNPNSVAPPEMILLERSITADGYTQPIVTWEASDHREVVDGFHRSRVGKESATVRERIHGYLPVVSINNQRADLRDRMAATIRHNRARGKHATESMGSIVADLLRQGWSNQEIAAHLGMEAEEVLRLKQVRGAASALAVREYDKAWEVDLD